ncbi:glycosyltransferase family 2 protein [Paracoccaceae bacterium GXU_MW_L88]
MPLLFSLILCARRTDQLGPLMVALGHQRLRNFEIILVSPSGDLVPEGPDGIPLTHVPFDEMNLSAARNAGLAAAKAPLVAYIDDDAIPEFPWLMSLAEGFADPSVASATGPVRSRNGVSIQSGAVMVDRMGRETSFMPDDVLIRQKEGSALKTVGTNMAFRAEALRAIGGFDPAFHYYLEEADVNLRLAAAGWSAAWCFLAEVHHYQGESPYRGVNRVPTSLYEIGASTAVFAAKHAGDKAAQLIDDARAEQRRRVFRFLEEGPLEPGDVDPLIASFDEGVEEGANREPLETVLAHPTPALLPDAETRNPKGRFLKGRLYNRKWRMDAAREAAAEGEEVTLLIIEPTARPLRVRFHEGGYWLHQIGQFGRASRNDRILRLRSTVRIVEAERRRIAMLRNFPMV